MEDNNSIEEWWNAHKVVIVTGLVFAILAVFGGIFIVYYGKIIYGQAGTDLMRFTRCVTNL